MELTKYREAASEFDRYNPMTEDDINRRIEENRKGNFVLRVTDAQGNAIPNQRIRVKLTNHEFKFGCAMYLLGQFDTAEKNALYEQRFAELFNYGVAPLYWDTLEPEEGHLRFAEDSAPIYRRPPVDSIVRYAREHDLRLKGHCLMYNSFNPKWMPTEPRALRIAVEKRIRTLAERYYTDFEDVDVINEMYYVYQNAYGENGMRNYPITDDKNHEEWCFALAKQYFPHSRLFWNEGCYESFSRSQYWGNKSRYYLMLKNKLNLGAPIEGIGMQFHAFDTSDNSVFNPVRQHDIFKTYGEFGLPFHISEISIPALEPSGGEGEEIQGELVWRMFRLWFSEPLMDGVVWWNMADGTAYGSENQFYAGLLNNDLSPKEAWRVLDRLIHRDWHTECELVTDADGRACFRGFYGKYRVSVGNSTEEVRLHRDNTGYYQLTGGLKEAKLVLK